MKEDGHYYEKVITWKKKPNYFYLFLSGICLTMFILSIISLYSIPDSEENNLTAIDAYGVYIGIIFTINASIIHVGWFLSAMYFFVAGLGEGRKIKYKRIGK